MDSTSIVCVADHLRLHGDSHIQNLETLSFYDESEPDWDERRFFSIVESIRGHNGIHIETPFSKRTISIPDESAGPWLVPGYDSGRAEIFQAIDQRLKRGNYRTVLSGMGGDELLGGVPFASSELGDALLRLHFKRFLKRSIQWSLPNRTPILHTFGETLQFLYELYRGKAQQVARVPPWLTSRARRALSQALEDDPIQIARFSVRPSFISNDQTWWALLESLPHLEPTPYERREYRYPYLDKDLVEFLMRVPREQLLGPGRRRLLMRRALARIVPNETLEQRRKAGVSRGPLLLLGTVQSEIHVMFRGSLLELLGWIDVQSFKTQLCELVTKLDPTWMLPILNTMSFLVN